MKRTRLLALLLIGAFAAMMPQGAQAEGTAVCTPITNTATVNYTVGTVSQAPKDGVATPFNVASKVNLEVTTTDGSWIPVIPGTGDKLSYLTFKVKNTGNTVQDYKLSALTKVNGTYTVWAANDVVDDFDATGVSVFVETTGAGYVAGDDTKTYIDELAPEGEVTVYIVATGTPALALTLVDGNEAVYALLAKTAQGGVANTEGDETTELLTAGVCNAPIVLADTAAGTGPDDGLKDGDDSSRSAFKVASARIAIDKVATTIWDPINYNNDPKAIPGALVRYVVTVSNHADATASAKLSTIGDTLITNLTMDPDLKTVDLGTATPTREYVTTAGYGFKANVTGTRIGDNGGLVAGTPKYYTTSSSADGIDLSGQAITATLTTLLPIDAAGANPDYVAGELKPGETLTLTFNVYIN